MAMLRIKLKKGTYDFPIIESAPIIDKSIYRQPNSKLMYWIYNFDTQEKYIAGSIVAVSGITKIPKDTLYAHFSRKKETELNRVNNDGWIISKKEVVKSTASS